MERRRGRALRPDEHPAVRRHHGADASATAPSSHSDASGSSPTACVSWRPSSSPSGRRESRRPPAINQSRVGTPRTAWGSRHPWPAFILRRLARLVASLFLLITVVVRDDPRDPGRSRADRPRRDHRPARAGRGTAPRPGTRPAAGPSSTSTTCSNTVTGDFGTSIITGQPVSEIISDRLPNTLRLVGAAFVFTIVVAYPLGLGMAIFTQNGRHRRTEVGFAGVTGFVQAIPDFVLATALVALFGVTWQILPVAESSGASAYVLPVLSLTLGSIAVLCPGSSASRRCACSARTTSARPAANVSRPASCTCATPCRTCSRRR